MKPFILMALLAAVLLQGEEQREIEIAIERYERDACERAKQQARSNYEIIDMTGCTCEMTDEREWQCFVRFTYAKKRTEPEE